MENIVGLKNLRENMVDYVKRIAKGESFIVFKQTKPLFKISPIEDEEWEEIIDFTKIKKGGVDIKEILSRL
jgi:antitoxin (DNA-binding transcriptional repressor) of toxin-antitoxin stability system